MLGHKMFQVLGQRFPNTWCTIREPRDLWEARGVPLLASERVLDRVEVIEPSSVEEVMRRLRPQLVVNCVGVIKQRSDATNAIPSITINALLPHRIAAVAAEWDGRLIHFSTDCVFSGSRGNYSEDDFSDAADLYGRSKFLGEVVGENALTLRTSIIGRELRYHRSLLDWFLQQNHSRISGFTQAWWSGVTTNHLAELVGDIAERHTNLSGMYQVSSGRVSKFHLLQLLRDGYGMEVEIVPDASVHCDRSLRGDRLRDAIGYACPPWDVLISQLVQDSTPYDNWAPIHDVS